MLKIVHFYDYRLKCRKMSTINSVKDFILITIKQL